MSPSLTARLETGLRLVAEIPAALLVLAEIGVLLSGVIARYVLHTPLIWSDELASILFLWLAMLGSVIALQRGEHMRLTAVVAPFAPPARARAEALTVAAVGLFLLMVVPSAWDYAADEWYIETPALARWRSRSAPC
jgi:TRAP-type C4-dicarboxylate transport system permease small subunit